MPVTGATAPAVRVRVARISLPGIVWNNREVLVSAAPVFSHFGLEESPAAIVGPGLLKDNSLAIDFSQQPLFIGPPITTPPPAR